MTNPDKISPPSMVNPWIFGDSNVLKRGKWFSRIFEKEIGNFANIVIQNLHYARQHPGVR